MKAGQWSMAWRNLARNRRRNIATGVAIGLGFAAFLAIGGYISQVENRLRVYTIFGTRVGHVTIYKQDGLERFSTKPKQYSLDEHDLAVIREIASAMPNVELHGPQLVGMGLIGNGCRSVPFLASGIEPDLDRKLRAHPEMKAWVPDIRDFSKGRGLWEYPESVGAIGLATGLAKILGKTKVYDDFSADHKAVVVADCLAADAKQKIASDSNVQLVAGSWSGMMAALDGEAVVNFNSGMTETNSAAIMMPLKLLQKLYDTDHATYYSLWLKDPSHLDRELTAVKSKLKDAGLSVDVYPWTDEAVAPFYTGTIQFLSVMTSFIKIVLASVIIFSIFNSATMTVIERSQEIGMMRSMGFTRRHVRQLFVAEMLLLTLLSVLGGGVVSFFGNIAVNMLKIHFNPPGVAAGLLLKIDPTVSTVAASTAVIFVLAVLTTLLAVRTVAKQNIAILLMGSQR